MKNVVLAFFLSISLLSCSSDDDRDNSVIPITSGGHFTVDGETYVVNRGWIIPPNSKSYGRYYIGFTDGDITYDGDYFTFENNVHHWVDFALCTSQAKAGSIENTTYNFPLDAFFDINQAFISSADVLTNGVFENGNLMSGNEHDSNMFSALGNLELTTNNGLYYISFSIIDNAGRPITGSYFGTLTTLN